ncbi:MAG: hypothetical protein WD873_08535 [Candidatus Hydrogenedentales bacterium]
MSHELHASPFEDGRRGLDLRGYVRSPPVPRSEFVGANGTKDAFAAGAIYGLHEGCR